MNHKNACRWGLAAIILGICIVPAHASAGLVDFFGFSWESGNFPPSAVNDRLEVVGMVSGLGEPLSWDPANKEYTFHVHRMVSKGQTVVGDNIVVEYTGGAFDIHEDDTFDADYGAFPPNATSPNTFMDGELYARFRIRTLTIFYNTVFQSGAFDGVVDVEGRGSHAGELAEFGSGMTFGGIFDFGSPDGYDIQWTGQILFSSVPVENTTWGSVKNLFRE